MALCRCSKVLLVHCFTANKLMVSSWWGYGIRGDNTKEHNGQKQHCKEHTMKFHNQPFSQLWPQTRTKLPELVSWMRSYVQFFFLFFHVIMQSCTNVIYTSVLLDGTKESFHAYAFLINNNNNNKICTGSIKKRITYR